MTELDVRPEGDTRVAATALHSFATAVFAAEGLPAGRARAAAASLCHGDLVGMTSHGLANLTRIYLPLLASGRARRDARPRVLADRDASVLLDGDRGLGLWLAGEAMELAARRAARHGVGMVAVRNATHFGCAGHYAAMAAAQGMVGLVAANCGRQRLARPPHGRAPLLGTNPLSVAAPAGTHPPFLLDMSTTTAPTGKVREAARAGAAVPPGWLAGDDGEPVTDPAAFDRGEAHLTWLGAPGPAAVKGFGLGLMVEVLAGLIPGAGMGPAPDTGDGDRDDDVGFLVLAFAPAELRGPGAVERDADALFGGVLDCPPSAAGGTVSYPGWPEAEHEARCRRDGVPVPAALLRELDAVADERGLARLGAC